VTLTATPELTATPRSETRFVVSVPVSYLNALLGQDDTARAVASAPVSYLNALPGTAVTDRFQTSLVVSYLNQ
jgi:hypothetical protein